MSPVLLYLGTFEAVVDYGGSKQPSSNWPRQFYGFMGAKDWSTGRNTKSCPYQRVQSRQSPWMSMLGSDDV